MTKEELTPYEAAVELTDNLPPLQGGTGFELSGIELEGLLDSLEATDPEGFDRLIKTLQLLCKEERSESMPGVTQTRAFTAARVLRLIGVIFGQDFAPVE